MIIFKYYFKYEWSQQVYEFSNIWVFQEEIYW